MENLSYILMDIAGWLIAIGLTLGIFSALLWVLALMFDFIGGR
jgi:hypothetical protein